MEPAISRHQQYLSGHFQMADAIEGYLARIDASQHLNAFIQVYGEDARQFAADLDNKRASGKPLGKLAGTVIAIKDNICMKGKRVTCGSRMLDQFVSPYSATVITKIIEADGLIIGKTNLDEFAMGSSTENSYYGAALNPIDTNRVAGGSSGGSAVAVATGMADLALGSDTGGSVRLPAAFCGVAGLKPSYGRVSRYGLVAYASSLDQIGTFGRTVNDAALLLEVIAGHDPLDSTASDKPAGIYQHQLTQPTAGAVFGIPAQFFQKGLDTQIAARIDAVKKALASMGHSLKPVSLPLTDYAIATYYIIATAEASSNLSRYDGVRYGHRSQDATDLESMYVNSRSEGFGPEVKRRIMLGTYVLSSGYYDAYYKKGMQVRRMIKDEYSRVFEEVDVLLTPTSPTPAFRSGERIDDPLQLYLSDIYTVTANLAGNCAISVPAGKTSDGLPIGLQLLCNAFEEKKLMAFAAQIEEVANGL